MELWVPIIVAAISGGALLELIKTAVGWFFGRGKERAAEVDRLSKQLRDAMRRERIATEWGHRNAVLAIRAGVPEDQMPVLDFKDD